MRHRFFALATCVVFAALTAGADKRSYVAGGFALEIGAETQFISGAEGGAAVGTVVSEKPGADRVVRKHLANVKYEDIVVQIQPTHFTNVIKDALDGKYSRYSGAVHFLDHDMKERRRQEFQQALVTAVRFPALDMGSKDAGRVELVLSPEVTREHDGQGNVLKPGGANNKSQTIFLPSSFRVTMDSFDTSKIIKVSAIEFRQKVVEDAVGEQRVSVKEPAGYDIPNITLTSSEADPKQWHKWHDDFVIKGANGQDKEKKMLIEYVSRNGQEVLVALELGGVGMVAVRNAKSERNADSGPRVEIELYAETIKVIGGGAKSTAAAAAAEDPAPAAKDAAPVAKDAAPVAKDAAPAAAPVARKRPAPVTEAPPAETAKPEASKDAAPAPAAPERPTRRPR